jgi:FKBP-type peptidyl-prolyl cis-trans isomerase SlyD
VARPSVIRGLRRTGTRGNDVVAMDASALRVGPDTVVTVAYRVYDDGGDLLADENAPITCLYGGGHMVPGLEKGLLGLASGERRSVVVPPELGYGAYDPDAVIEVERSDFPHPERIHVGDEFVAESPDGEELPLTIVDVREDSLVVDMNHPLAGETLRFDVTVVAVKPVGPRERAEADRERGRQAPLLTLGRKPAKLYS